MVEFTVKYASLNCQWGFKDTFVSLPAPGDESFSALYKSLLPYGITLSSITFEVELLSEYSTPGEISKFVKQAIDDWHQAMASLDLKLSAMGSEDDASK